MKKRKKSTQEDKEFKFFQWVLLIPLLPIIIFATLMIGGNCESSFSNWITLVTSCVASFATILLGVIVYFQTENHKKRQEEDNALYQEQSEINRKQDLMIRANPHAVFNKIECIRYAQGSMSLTKENTYNRLTNIDFEDFHTFEEHTYMDLNFTIPQNNVLERVYIKSVELKCYKGEFMGGNFEEIAKYSLVNYSPNENTSNIKINTSGGVDALLSLLFDTNNEKEFWQRDIKNLLDDGDIKWAITIYYTLSNSFDIEIDYKTHINFSLTEGYPDSYGDIAYSLVQPIITTIQTSNIKIKEQRNESNS